MCLIFHNWSDVYEEPVDLSIYQDIADNLTFTEEARRLAKLILKINIKKVELRRCLDCGQVQSLTIDRWSEYKPTTKSSIRDFKIKKLLDIK